MNWFKKVFLVLVFLSLGTTQARAQTLPEATSGAEATRAAEATMSGEVQEGTPSSQPAVALPKEDITQPTEEVKSKLARYLKNKQIGELSATNFLQHAIRNAVDQGIPANTIVLLLLFPMVAALIAASRHLLGLKGFGIFVPAMLSVAFVATGIITGILVFLTMLGVAMLARKILKGSRLQYLPRMALMLWFVGVGMLGLVFISPILNLEPLKNISIFPILILLLLNEKFIETQLGKSKREAKKMTLETIIIALACSIILSMQGVQRFAILNPEITLFLTAAFNVFVGKYSGLRLMERWKFRKLIEQ